MKVSVRNASLYFPADRPRVDSRHRQTWQSRFTDVGAFQRPAAIVISSCRPCSAPFPLKGAQSGAFTRFNWERALIEVSTD